MVGGEKEEIASSPENNKSSVKVKTFYMSQDTVTEEKCLSGE